MAKPTDTYPWAINAGATADPGPSAEGTGFRAGKKPPAKWFNFLLNGAHQWFTYLNNLPNENAFRNAPITWGGPQTWLDSAVFDEDVNVNAALSVSGNVTGAVDIHAARDLVADRYAVASRYYMSPPAANNRLWAAAQGVDGDPASAAWNPGLVRVTNTGTTGNWVWWLNARIPSDVTITDFWLHYSWTSGGTHFLRLQSWNEHGDPGTVDLIDSIELNTPANGGGTGTNKRLHLPITSLAAAGGFTPYTKLFALDVAASGAPVGLVLHSVEVKYDVGVVWPGL